MRPQLAQTGLQLGEFRVDIAEPTRTGSRSETISATQTGFSAPSRSTVAFVTNWTPLLSTSFTSSTSKCARSRLPTGTGAGKRTLLTP